MTTTVDAAAGVDADLARLVDTLGGISDGDLHRASFGGGWTVAQVVSHISVSTLVWLGNLRRLEADPELGFFFREEIGHDAFGYPPPTVAIARPASPVPAAPSPPACRQPTRRSSTGRVEIPDLGTMTVVDWTPIIIGHLTGHVEQALDDLRKPDAASAGGVTCAPGAYRRRSGPAGGSARARRPAGVGGRAVESASLCGTDSHQYDGRIDTPFPRVPGHDFAGRVESVGEGVDESLVGHAGGGQAVTAVRGLR